MPVHQLVRGGAAHLLEVLGQLGHLQAAAAVLDEGDRAHHLVAAVVQAHLDRRLLGRGDRHDAIGRRPVADTGGSVLASRHKHSHKPKSTLE